MKCNRSRCKENEPDGKCRAPKGTKFNASWCPRSKNPDEQFSRNLLTDLQIEQIGHNHAH